jgi:hypothetical protein
MTIPVLMSDAEIKAGAEPLADLLHERRLLAERLAPLYALYGPGGLAESMLSAERSRIVGLLRAMAAATEQKITEAALETGSRAHPEYLGSMAKHTTGRADYFLLNAAYQAVEYRIFRGQAVMRMFTAEARLG